MEWYWSIIIMLSIAWFCSFALVLHFVGQVDELRTENVKLRIALRHK